MGDKVKLTGVPETMLQTVRLRVISDVRATETAMNVPSTPEDYYLYVFNDIFLS